MDLLDFLALCNTEFTRYGSRVFPGARRIWGKTPQTSTLLAELRPSVDSPGAWQVGTVSGG